MGFKSFSELISELQADLTASVMSLDGYKLDEEKILHLSEVAKNRIFKELDIDGCSIGSETFNDFFLNFPTQGLTKLSLKNGYLGKANIKTLTQFIGSCQNLIALDLSFFAFNQDDFAQLCQSLQKHPTLQRLNLSGHVLSEAKSAYVADLLKQNETLVEINLFRTSLSQQGIALLTEGLENNHTLEVLHLHGNSLGLNSVSSLSKIITTNSSLKAMNIEGNKLQAEGVSALIESLYSNHRITYFKVGCNGLKSDKQTRKQLDSKVATILARNSIKKEETFENRHSGPPL